MRKKYQPTFHEHDSQAVRGSENMNGREFIHHFTCLYINNEGTALGGDEQVAVTVLTKQKLQLRQRDNAR